MTTTFENRGEYAAMIFQCGHEVRTPIGYKLTKTYELAKEFLKQYEKEGCLPCRFPKVEKS